MRGVIHTVNQWGHDTWKCSNCSASYQNRSNAVRHNEECHARRRYPPVDVPAITNDLQVLLAELA